MSLQLCFDLHHCYVHFLCTQHVVPHTPYQMDREATTAPLLGEGSPTPVIQGTG